MSNDWKVILTVVGLVILAKLCACSADVGEAPIDDWDGAAEVYNGAAGAGELGKPDREISNVRLNPVDDLERVDAGDELGDAATVPDTQVDAGDCDIAGDWHLAATFSVLCFNSNADFELTISDQESTCPTIVVRELNLNDSHLGAYEGAITYELNLNESDQLVGSASASGTLTSATLGTLQCDTDGTIVGTRN